MAPARRFPALTFRVGVKKDPDRKLKGQFQATATGDGLRLRQGKSRPESELELLLISPFPPKAKSGPQGGLPLSLCSKGLVSGLTQNARHSSRQRNLITG